MFKMKGPTFFNSPFKVDLKKKTGLGPRTNKAMGEQFPQGNDKFREDQEDDKMFVCSKCEKAPSQCKCDKPNIVNRKK